MVQDPRARGGLSDRDQPGAAAVCGGGGAVIRLAHLAACYDSQQFAQR
jgi:hypothetical protein